MNTIMKNFNKRSTKIHPFENKDSEPLRRPPRLEAAQQRKGIRPVKKPKKT